jgi:hypothetical protein
MTTPSLEPPPNATATAGGDTFNFNNVNINIYPQKVNFDILRENGGVGHRSFYNNDSRLEKTPNGKRKGIHSGVSQKTASRGMSRPHPNLRTLQIIRGKSREKMLVSNNMLGRKTGPPPKKKKAPNRTPWDATMHSEAFWSPFKTEDSLRSTATPQMPTRHINNIELNNINVNININNKDGLAQTGYDAFDKFDKFDKCDKLGVSQKHGPLTQENCLNQAVSNSKAILIKTFHKFLNFPKTLLNKKYGTNYNDLIILSQDFLTNDRIIGLFRTGKDTFFNKRRGRGTKFIKFKWGGTPGNLKGH